jgi:AraC-like DNA-binding protein
MRITHHGWPRADAAFFRRLFKRKTGVTPARYRLRFQSIGRARRKV